MPLKRCAGNPILARADLAGLPGALADPSAVFNPGAVALGGRTILLLRIQTRGRETLLLRATSRDGRRLAVAPEPVVLAGLEALPEPPLHVYDPRLTLIDGRIHAVLALDTLRGCRLGFAVSEDGEHYRFLGLDAGAERRNGVLFPERFDGRYLRLDRPNNVSLPRGGGSGDMIVLSASDDLIHWQNQGIVARGRPAFWDELIGPGPPPIRTRAGWLLIYHGIATHAASGHLYQAGVMLLDSKDPRRVIARSRRNILEPRESYEIAGQVPNVVFPTGLVVSGVDSGGAAPPEAEVRLYYGAADTCIALATGTVADLLAACER